MWKYQKQATFFSLRKHAKKYDFFFESHAQEEKEKNRMIARMKYKPMEGFLFFA